ncbi:MBG domain-containing protein [Chitinophaga arvensicola]|uniref:MBG domain-containing protein n=1 Tax=Chitinophaga arvensicola TaxID=29529 RepID=UPI0015A4FF84|nr:MBG domain-containing protein [Chitinophaga arvensicola]
MLTFLLRLNTGYAQGYTESFNNISTLSGSGWIIQNNSTLPGSATWFQGKPTTALPDPGPFNAYAGADDAYIGVDANSVAGTGTISNWLIMPNRTLRNGDVLMFYTRKPTIADGHPDLPDRLEVRMSANGGSINVGSTAPGVGDFTDLLLAINPTQTTGTYPESWAQYTITISGLPAPTSGRLAFRYFVTNGGPAGPNSDYIGIDEVTYVPYVCPEITLTTASIPSGRTGTAYNQTISQTGTLGPPSFAITGGALPPGLTLSTSGVVSGTPTATGTFFFTVTVFDASGCSASKFYSVTIVCATNPVNFTAPLRICSNEPPIELTTGSPAGGSYSGTGVSGGYFDPSAGTQVVSYDYTDPYGCAFSSSAVFTVTNAGTTQVSNASQSICPGTAISTIALTNTATSATFNWTRDNTTSVTGIAASGTGDISGILENTTSSPVTVTFTITSTTSDGCTPDPVTATVEVKNRAVITSPTTMSQTICSGNNITPIILTGSSGVTAFNWTRSNTTAVTGIAAAGSGNISGTLTNTTTAPADVTFTVTPVADACDGTPADFTVKVNPQPAITALSVPGAGTYKGSDPLEFTVTYTEDVVVNTSGGVPAVPLTLNTGGTVSANYVSGSGSSALLFRYTVSATDQDPDGISIGNTLHLNGAAIESKNGCSSLITLNNVPPTTDIKIHNPVPQNITFNNMPAKTYGEADFAPGATSSSALAITYTSSNPAVATITGNQVHIVGAGTTTITASQAGNGDYLPATAIDRTLQVNPKSITVTADPISKIYGEADPALTYTLTPALIPGDKFTGALGRTGGENTGAYAINQGTLALNSNYALSYTANNLTITAKPVTVTAETKSKKYGEADPALTYSVSPELVTGDKFTGALSRSTGENVGLYTINQGTLALNSNYTLSYTNNDLTIIARPIMVTVAAKSKTYGETDPELTYSASPALINSDKFTGALSRTSGENIGIYEINQGTLALSSNYLLSYASHYLTITAKPVTVTVAAKSKTYGETDPAWTYSVSPALINSDKFTGALSRTAGENAGTYAINQGTLALNGNYILSYAGSDLTITGKPVTVTVAAKSKTYGETDPAWTYSVSPALINSDKFTGALSRTAGENAGTYAINQGTLALNGNYLLSYTGNDLTINAKPVTVTVAAKSKTYGETDPAFTYSVSPTLISGDKLTGALSRTAGENTGTYTINQGTLASNGNYILSYTGNNLTITAKPVTVTAAAKNKVYGEADPALTYDISSALVNGDKFTGALSRTAGENIGTYGINQGTLALNGNYILSYTGNDLRVTTKPVTVTAAAKSKAYGEADPALTYGVSPALVNGDKFTGSLSRTAGESIGAYGISQGSLALNSNYSISYTGNNLTVTAREVTVTAEAKSKVYGDADPVFTYTVSPALLPNDAFTGTLGRATGDNAGSYTIEQRTLALNSNYTIHYNPASLVINKAVLTATAGDKTICPEEPLAAVPVSYTGFKNGETVAALNKEPVVNIPSHKTAGNYALTPSDGAASNYSFNYVNGQLTVLPAPSGNISQQLAGAGIYQLTAPSGTGYLWSNGETTNTINVKTSGNYTVAVTGEQGCKSQFSWQLAIQNISIPNTFSPNGDGVNDYWTIPELANYPQANVAIINRDGQLVFESKNFSRWDGKNAGKDLPAGVYFYRVIKTPGDTPVTGWLNLLK